MTPKRFEVLTTRTCEWASFGNTVFAELNRCHQGGPEANMTTALSKEGWTQTHTPGGGPVKMEAGVRERNPRPRGTTHCHRPPEPRRQAQPHLPTASGGTHSAHTTSDSQVRTCSETIQTRGRTVDFSSQHFHIDVHCWKQRGEPGQRKWHAGLGSPTLVPLPRNTTEGRSL